jgi:hypothetical protein
MKKALVVLLILAVAGGLFAQELTWSGAVKTGLRFEADDGDKSGAQTKVRLYSDDADVISRFELNGAYAADNWGLKFRFRADNLTDVSVHQAYGWVTFLDDVVKLSVGKIKDGTWGTQGIRGYDITGSGTRLEVTPIEGLNVGLILRVPDNAIAVNLVSGDKDWFTVKQFLGETALGFSYASDFISAGASLELDGTIDGLGTDDDTWFAPLGQPGDGTVTPSLVSGVLTSPGTLDADGTLKYADDHDKGLRFQIGVAVNPIENLSISAEAFVRNAGNFSELGWMAFDEEVSYKLLDSKLKVGLKAYQLAAGEDVAKAIAAPLGADEKAGLYLKLTPYVSYQILDPLSIGLEASIGIWSDILASQISIKPKLSYALGGGATLNAYYNFSSVDYEDKYDPADPTVTNAIQIDLIWTF